jgi:hypothetical protein
MSYGRSFRTTGLIAFSLTSAAFAQPPEADAVARPFGKGQPVEVQCSEPGAYVFVAQGALDARPSYPDPFVKVGAIPVQLELPPGVFTLLVEGERITSQSVVFEVRQQPLRVRVNPGSQGLRDLSTLMLALGGAAILGGAVLEASGTGGGDASTKRKITIPLFIGGGVGFASGLTMYFVSGTSIEHDGFVSPSATRELRFVATF